MRTKKQLKEIAKSVAMIVHSQITIDEAMDGDETEYLAEEFLKELDRLNANL